MTLILHLSDLHLGQGGKDDVLGDYKSEIVPLLERQQRQQLLRNTLEELGRNLRRTGKRLDAIVVNGDVTVANDKTGFQKLHGVLKDLGSSCPPPEHIVIVPGNHDVTWETAPSQLDRYSNFTKYFRDSRRQYITPLLDGIDFAPKGSIPLTADRAQGHYWLDLNSKLVIVPINSSNYCGSLEPIEGISTEDWEKVLRLMENGPADTLRRALKRLRLHDVARISTRQFEALGNLLRHINAKVKAAGVNPSELLRVAVLHHHLLPVTLNEEFKSFESITNLGHLRHFLRQHKFQVVLHGHKHTGFIYWDHIYDASKTETSTPHRILVISGSSVGNINHGDEVCKLIEMKSSPFVSEVIVNGINAVPVGTPIDTSSGKTRLYRLWNHSSEEISWNSPDVKYIKGKTLDEAYERVLTIFDELEPHTVVSNVVCQIENVSKPLNLPQSYPSISDNPLESPHQWFDDLVEWWQRSTLVAGTSQSFTHGNRIYAYEGEANDQLERAISALNNNEKSSRAFISLVQPNVDLIDTNKKFPSFCSVQFVIRSSENSTLHLDCIGYFRKQEIKYWWPINVAELFKLREEVLRSLSVPDKRSLKPGAITTIAAMASVGSSPPQVLVPKIDRLLVEDRSRLWSMIYALFHEDTKHRSSLLAQWAPLLEDIVPSESFNPDGVPIAVAGVQFIAEQVSMFSQQHNAQWSRDLSSYFHKLLNINSVYLNMMNNNQATKQDHAKWRSEVAEIVKSIREVIKSVSRRSNWAKGRGSK